MSKQIVSFANQQKIIGSVWYVTKLDADDIKMLMHLNIFKNKGI